MKEMTSRALSRRELLALLGGAAGLSAVAAACAKGSPSSGPSPLPSNPTIADIKRGATQISVLSPDTPVNPGDQPFSFALVTNQQQLVAGGSPQVWLAPKPSATATGPFTASWYRFTGYEKTGDRSPSSDITGAFVVDVKPATTGFWVVAVRSQVGSQPVVGTGTLPVTNEHIPAAIGSRATSIRTPVATSRAKIAQICTRTPVCAMHYVSLDEALGNGRPTVAVFSTPLLCESRLCGPVTDEQILVFEKIGAAKANFIHVEEFLPGPDLQPPSASLKTRSPAFKAWGFTTEPWVIVIDRKGVIRGRLGPGPVFAPQIDEALRPLL